MKRKLLYVFSFVAITLAFSSCEDNCKVCKRVYYDSNGNYKSEDQTESEYCGVELLAIDGKTVDLGALGTAKWQCNK